MPLDAQLRDQGWEITNTNAVRFEYVLTPSISVLFTPANITTPACRATSSLN